MMLALGLAALWLALARAVGHFPRRELQGRAAAGLVLTGIPLLGWVTWTVGPLWGMLMLAGGAVLLRGPLGDLARHIRGT